MRVLLGAFGDPGHAFPMLALGRALAARGHEVTLQTWARWQEHVEGEGLRFAPAPEYEVFPSGPGRLDFYEALERAAMDSVPLVVELRPEVVVADILTLAPALAAELQGVPWTTLIPHVYPPGEPHFPVYSLGARLPRSAAGRALWRAAHAPVARGLELGRAELNGVRTRLGLEPLEHRHGGISRRLAIVGTFPQLEYPRRWPANVHVVGPLMWEPPAHDVELPPGDGPLVLIAPSTAHDSEHRLLRAALRGLADAPVRVLATWNRRLPAHALPVPENARLVDWLSYSRTMPRCDVVVCHAGHGTLARALACGCAVVAAPAVGDMNENAARLAWAGAGVRLPRRFVSPRSIRLAVGRALGDPAIKARARELAQWACEHDAGATAARLIERLAGSSERAPHEPDRQQNRCDTRTRGRRRCALPRRFRRGRHRRDACHADIRCRADLAVFGTRRSARRRDGLRARRQRTDMSHPAPPAAVARHDRLGTGRCAQGSAPPRPAATGTSGRLTRASFHPSVVAVETVGQRDWLVRCAIWNAWHGRPHRRLALDARRGDRTRRFDRTDCYVFLFGGIRYRRSTL